MALDLDQTRLNKNILETTYFYGYNIKLASLMRLTERATNRKLVLF